MQVDREEAKCEECGDQFLVMFDERKPEMEAYDWRKFCSLSCSEEHDFNERAANA